MNILSLCKRIGLQKEVQNKVSSFANTFDFAQIDTLLAGFRNQDTMESALRSIQQTLGEDENHIKILSCMLKSAADAYDVYRQLGIHDEIYIATMKCFPRFIEEYHQITGEYAFDREWWTARQVGCHFFRLGSLEYEIRKKNGEHTISIHIPSDADLSEEMCNVSLDLADSFFKNYYPKYATCKYLCHSWMIAPELDMLLPEKSNIRKFKNRFEIMSVGNADTEYLRWIYKTQNNQVETLPENTTLQRNLKTYLLKGGKLRDAVGFLKQHIYGIY